MSKNKKREDNQRDNTVETHIIEREKETVITLHIVSKPTFASTNWFLRSPFKVTGIPTTCKKLIYQNINQQ